MAELGIKLKIDGVETTLKSFNDVEDRIASLKKQVANAEVGGDKFKALQKELKATEAAYTGAQIKNQSFLDSLSKAPGIMGTLGQSIKGVGQGFQALAANPFVAVASVLVAVVTKIIEKMSSMEVITDSLGKVMGAFGAIVGNIVNAVVTPLAEGIAYLIDGMTSLMSVFSDSAKDGADFADALDSATEAEKENAIAVAEANAALAEAREKAADATLSTQERTKALQDAAAIEKKVTEDSIKINTQKLAAQLGTIATEIGARQDLINQIKSGSLEEIKAARASLLAMKNVDKDKVYALDQMIIEIENSKRKSANIQRKTDKEIAAIENAAQKEREQAAKDAETKRLERIKKANAEAIKELDAKIANEIAKENTSKEELKKILDARMAYDLQGIKKGSEQEAKIRREYAEKLTQAIDADLKKRSDDTVKAIAEGNKEVAKQEQKALTANQEIRDEELNQIQLALSKQLITEDQARQKSFDAAKKQGDADLKLLQDNQKAQLDELEKNKSKLTNEAYLAEKEKITEKYESRIANQTKTNNKLTLDNALATNKQIAESNKKLQEDRLALLDLEFNNEFTSYDRRIAILREKQATMLADASLTADARKKIEIETSQAITEEFVKERQKYIDATNAAADAAGQLSQAFGEETDAGYALLKVQQALTLAAQIATFVTQIQTLTKKADAQATTQQNIATVANTAATAGNTVSTAANTVTSAGNAIVKTTEGAASGVASAAKIPFPANLVAIIAMVATFAGIIATIKSMLAGRKQAEAEAGGTTAGAATSAGSKFAKGGLLVGPSHADGGIKSPYGELEGGEYVVNKRSTKSFMPLLQSINAVGNRRYANGGMTPSMGDLQEMITNQPQPIIKTYVVSSEMTSAMEADKKIGDLARL
jgi:hypothetical protein